MSCTAECSGTFSFVAGETQLLVFHLMDEFGAPFNASGGTASFAISEYVNTSTPLLTKPAEISESLVKVNLSSLDTIHILPNKYIYQLTVVSHEGIAEVPARGFALVQRNVDRASIIKE